VLAFVNVFLLGAGAKVYGDGTLLTAITAAAIVIPIFLYRHYISDKGQFPAEMFGELAGSHSHWPERRKAGPLPYVTLAAGAAVILAGALFSQ
jgi:hypothetical protein